MYQELLEKQVSALKNPILGHSDISLSYIETGNGKHELTFDSPNIIMKECGYIIDDKDDLYKRIYFDLFITLYEWAGKKISNQFN